MTMNTMMMNSSTMTNMMMIMKKSPREASFIKAQKTMIKILMRMTREEYTAPVKSEIFIL